MLNVLYDIASGSLIKLRHLLLRQPDGLVGIFDFDASFAILAPIYNYLIFILHIIIINLESSIQI